MITARHLGDAPRRGMTNLRRHEGGQRGIVTTGRQLRRLRHLGMCTTIGMHRCLHHPGVGGGRSMSMRRRRRWRVWMKGRRGVVAAGAPGARRAGT